MLKFTLGLTSGIVIGGAGTMIFMIVGLIALEDSPEVLETLSKRANG